MALSLLSFLERNSSNAIILESLYSFDVVTLKSQILKTEDRFLNWINYLKSGSVPLLDKTKNEIRLEIEKKWKSTQCDLGENNSNHSLSAINRLTNWLNAL